MKKSRILYFAAILSTACVYLIFESDLVRELIAQFPGGGGRIGQQGLGVAVHEGDGQHQGLLRLGGLELQPRRRLVPRPVVERPFQTLLAVGRVPGGTVPTRFRMREVIDIIWGDF